MDHLRALEWGRALERVARLRREKRRDRWQAAARRENRRAGCLTVPEFGGRVRCRRGERRRVSVGSVRALRAWLEAACPGA
jgi:hypothetical protein